MDLLSEHSPTGQHVCADLDGRPGSVTLARRTAEAFLAALTRAVPPGGEDTRDSVLLVVSELVTNATRHAPGPLTLCLTHLRDGVHAVVYDTSTLLPRPRTPDLARGTGGFGWPLVQRLARDLRTAVRPDGKEVHAVLAW
ncbi:ATP-binding protein [Streptacidiphilus sp. ASG 303]|uniref:ATP-binding protein n=1 Tax=Streptacidiphilus sp. ASG 303 TaxID=2896847 RepID=UPI001E5247D3|nr:ATP-binding protein [Streptacidiphilus sp. ASG 303]MCD0485479.1 ATP-binding protein [Streptacidiphilus sp. ASG 303]